jgi:tetratricopeptide (TPR) repeat protein
MSDDDRPTFPKPSDETDALVPHTPGAPVELKLADSLESADHGMFVHIDGKGQVRSPARYHALTALAYGLSAGAILASTILYMDMFGPVGSSVGVVLSAALAVGVGRGRRMIRAAALIQADRLEEAEMLCRELLAGRFVPKQLRASAYQNLAAIATRRGQFDVALEHVRRAIQLRHSAFRLRNVVVDILAYTEVTLLVNLGRVGEARARMDARGQAPGGDFLRVQHWTAELYVQFAEQRLGLEEDALWERSQAALRITGAGQLLALCSWAYTLRGDEDMAQHLLEQAIDRAEPSAAATFPLLWRWVDQRRVTLGLGAVPSSE